MLLGGPGVYTFTVPEHVAHVCQSMELIGMKSLKRPRGLIVVISVQVLAGLLSLLGGIVPSAFSLTAQAHSLGFLQFLAPALPIVLVVLGVFYLSLSYGLWKGHR